MRFLLDTHAFLWFILNDKALSSTARQHIIDPTNMIEISPASYWEIAIKVAIGKYMLKQLYQTFLEDQVTKNSFLILPIEIKHTAVLTTLPMHHRDPFDRLLVAQALVEQIAIISGDPQFDAYGVLRIW
jgi:PIN domain nuclease of toxin-antitoxin system